MKTIELSEDDWDLLLLALGMAARYADEEGNRELFRRILGLANTINKDTPDWTPYEVPA